MEYNPSEDDLILMETLGGSFEKSLVLLWRMSGKIDRMRISIVFGILFEKYHHMRHSEYSRRGLNGDCHCYNAKYYETR